MSNSISFAGTRRVLVSTLMAGLAITASCGGGDSPPTEPPKPPTPTQTVTTVGVSPSTADLAPLATTQLTATARDAAGTVMTGLAVAWTSSATAVATVSQSGLVTAVASGSATVTATISGVQGQSAITVAQVSPYGPMVAQTVIGPAGGTLSGADVGITIPAGALTTPRTISLIRDTLVSATPGVPYATSQYVVSGMPSGQVVNVRARVRFSGTVTGVAAIGVEQPALASGDEVKPAFGLSLYQATDSAGFLVATVPITGKPVTWSTASSGATAMRLLSAAADDPLVFDADAMLSGMFGLSRSTSGTGRFVSWGFNSVDADIARKTVKAAALLDQAYTKLTTDLAYTAPARTWPMQVIVGTTDGSFGIFSQYYPYPFNHERSYISFLNTHVDAAEFPGTVIHELFHFVQQNYRTGLTEAEYFHNSWLQEASSGWVESQHPASPSPYFGDVTYSWRDSLFSGLSLNLVAQSGYGKAPMLKYIANRWGNPKVRDIWSALSSGTPSQQTFLATLPEPASEWWPLAITQYFGGSLYPWTAEQLMPRKRYVDTLKLMEARWVSPALYPLQAHIGFLRRDTSKLSFGPNFQMPLYIHPMEARKPKLLVFEKLPAAVAFKPILGTDTVWIPGHRLNSSDSIIYVVTRPDMTNGFNAQAGYQFGYNLRLPEGDWTFPEISEVNDNIAFACSDTSVAPSDFDVADNAVGAFTLLSNYGSWKWRTAAPITYDWVVDPLYVDSLTELNMQLTSDLVVNNDGSVRVQARLKMNYPKASLRQRDSGLLPATFGGDTWWMVVPLGVFAIVTYRRTRQWPRRRRVGALVSSVVLVTVASCVGLAIAEWRFDQTFEYTFPRVVFTADPNNPSAPLMELTNGSGKTVMNDYHIRLWIYHTDPITNVTDSTDATCTGGGIATYKVGGVAYSNGLAPVPEEFRSNAQTTQFLSRSTGMPLNAEQAARIRKIIKPQ